MKHEFLRRFGALLLCLVLALSLSSPALAADEGGETGGTETGSTTTGGDNQGGEDDKGDEGGEGDKGDDDDETPEKIVFVDSAAFARDEFVFREPNPRVDTLSISVNPTDATYKSFDFKSDDKTVVTIEAEKSELNPDLRNSAVLTPIGPGEAYVTASLNGYGDQKKINTTCLVTVSGIVISYAKGVDANSSRETKLADSIAQNKGCDDLLLTVGISQNVAVKKFGEAKNTTKIEWYSSNNIVVSVNSAGRLTPRSPGTTRITATCGSFSASFDVTVNENTTGLVKITDSIPAGVPMSFLEIRDEINDQFRADTYDLYEKRKDLDYVTSLNVSPSQGILYKGYISEADTGAGVSMTDRFYYGSSGLSDYRLSGVTFVPNSTFSGNAEISYTGVSNDGSTVSGIIRIPVDAMKDVSYTTGSGQNVFFRGSDFSTICRLQTGRELSGVTFTLPSSSRGTLYYGYTADNQYSEKVDATTRYRRTGNPNLDSVSFLPADGFAGSVRISYRGTDTAGGTFSGSVTVTVTERAGDADVIYYAKAGKDVSFTASKFNTACRNATGESLEHVRFTLPDSSEGTLYYTYGSSERKVTENTYFYRSSSYSLNISDVYFVPAKNAPDRIRIAYTGRSTYDTDYSGTVLIDYSGTAKSEAISYSVYSGRAVQFDVSDFNTASIDATGSTLNYVYFELPSASRGLLCYNYTSASSPRSVSSTTRYYRSTSGSNRIDRVWFLADPGFSGTVEIPYTGYSNNGEDFTGTVSIRVSSLTPAEVRFSGGAAQPIALSASQIRYACNAVMDKELSYIEFTSLPSSTQGRIYRGYTGYDSGTQAVTGTPYYVSASPGIDQLSFVPRGGFSGTAYAGYTGVSTSGERVSGTISFSVASAGTSAYFNDMAGYSWAVAAADYLYQNGIINGVGSGRYAPGDNIRRCDFVVMLCRAYNFSGGSGMAFADVPSGSYYASAVSTASGLGIVNGDGNNFRPNDQLTRQDAMVIIKRALEAAGWSLGGNTGSELYSFGDANSVSSYARDAVATLVRLGAVNGGSNGNLRPRAPINRAEAAVILHYVMTM